MVVTRVKLRSPIGPIAVGVLLFLQIFSPARAILFLLLIISGVLGISYYWARELGRGIQLHRFRRYGWAQVGDIIEERFILRNAGIMPAIWVDIRDHSNLPGYTASRATGVGARGTTRWTTEGSCSQRGIYTLGPMELHTSDPFGLFDVTLEHQYSESFVVYPPLASIPRLFEPRGVSRGSARTNIRTLDLTTNAGGVRQYVPGDALNRVHWGTTARRSTPNDEKFFVKEFDLEPSGDLWIIVDMDTNAQAGQGLESTEEYAVILAASLANEMLLANHAVGLFTHTDGPLVVPPKKGTSRASQERPPATLGDPARAGRAPRRIGRLVGRGALPVRAHRWARHVGRCTHTLPRSGMAVGLGKRPATRPSHACAAAGSCQLWR